MLITTALEALQRLAPPSFAGAWDNVGLIAGNASGELTGSIFLTIDLTPEVAQEAAERGAGLVVAYHPPIFEEVRTLTDRTREGRAVLRVIGTGAAVYSPHTALDAAPGGVADWLLDRVVGEREQPGTRRAMVPHAAADPTQTHKVVAFVPREQTDRLIAAMTGAGAGVIGDYSHCSYTIEGRGTFLGGETSNPAVGQRGTLERVEETRVEMVCGRQALPDALAALRATHPYEEPAFDVHELAPRPDRLSGAGRWCRLAAPIAIDEIAGAVKTELGVESVRLGAPAGAEIDRVAVCPGAGAGVLRESGLLRDAAGLLFVTGEMGHHDVLDARAADAGVALAGHTRTERGYLPVLRDRLVRELSRAGGPPIDITISERDAWPLRTV